MTRGAGRRTGARSACRNGVAGGLLAGLALLPAPALAGKLYAPWRLEPTTPGTAATASFGKPFLEQRLLPVRAVTLSAAAVMADGRSVPAGTPLFLVYDDQRRIAFCTEKDFSGKRQLSTLFIPLLDKRPCFVDRDGDGRFDATFQVFDTYGSAATPSGDLGSATPIGPVGFRPADPHALRTAMRMAFALGGSGDPAKTVVRVQFDRRGTGKWEAWNGRFPRQGPRVAALNAAVTIGPASDKRAGVSWSVDPAIHIIGSSGGVFLAAPLPAFLQRGK